MESAHLHCNSGPNGGIGGAAWDLYTHLVKALMSGRPPMAEGAADPLSMIRVFALEAERWLKNPTSMPPSWQPLQALSSLGMAGQGGLSQTSQRTIDLLARWSQLQAELAARWSGVARAAGEQFILRTGGAKTPLDFETMRRLYDTWIECAERAYADIVHSDKFCRLQAELINVSCTLLLEQRAHIEGFGNLIGLPSRSEVEALRSEIRQMRNGGGDRPHRGAAKSRRRKGRAG